MSDSSFMNEGIIETVESAPDRVVPKKLQVSDRSTFAELSEDFVFYTPALLMIYGDLLPFDVIQQFYAVNNLNVKPYILVTDEPMFDGLETPPAGNVLNHFLMAIERPLWKDMALHLGTIGIRDQTTGAYFGTEIQKLPMADYLALKHMSVLPHPVPVFDMYAVAMDGNKACLHFVPAKNPPIDRIKLVRSTPRQQVIEYADSISKRIEK